MAVRAVPLLTSAKGADGNVTAALFTLAIVALQPVPCGGRGTHSASASQSRRKQGRVPDTGLQLGAPLKTFVSVLRRVFLMRVGGRGPLGCCSFTGPWTVTRSSLRMLRRGAAFCRPLRPVLLLVSFPRTTRTVPCAVGCSRPCCHPRGGHLPARRAQPPPLRSTWALCRGRGCMPHSAQPQHTNEM